MIEGYNKFVLTTCLLILILLGGRVAEADTDTTTLTRQRQWFEKAEKALNKGGRKQFWHWMNKLDGYPLTPYLLYRYYLKYPAHPDRIARFLNQYADTRYARPVRAALLKYLAGQDRWRDYLWFYQDLGQTALRCHYAWALYRQGLIDQAWRETRRLWLSGRSQPKACDKVFKAWKKAGNLTPDLIWRRFELALRHNKTRLAEYLARSLDTPGRHRAAFWISVHRKPESLLCQPWPKAYAQDGRIFAHGIVRLARKDLDAALELWDRRGGEFELSPTTAARVRRYIGLRLARHHDGRAWRWLSAVAGPEADDEIHAWRVRAALRRRDWSRVSQALREMPVLLRRDPQWRYWQAMALRELRQKDAARQVFEQIADETGFYGFMAADLLQQNYRIPHRPIGVPEQAIVSLERSPTVRAIREFLKLDRYWEARREWWHLLDQADRQELLAAALLAQRMDWPHMAIFAVARAEHWDDLEIRFPLRYLDQVQRQARHRKLDPAYIFGIIRRESAFDVHSRSPVGARGLMQLMPYTARRMARQLRERFHSARALEDSDLNVRYGTAYFSSLLKRFAGHFVLATAAYNAGPHRVERWLPRATLPADIWIETIPFRETRRYVRAVLSYAVIYRKRLGRPARRISEYASPIPAMGVKAGRPSRPVCRKKR